VCLKKKYAQLVLLGSLAMFDIGAPAAAQVTTIESEDGSQPTVYKMTVSAAAEPKRALKYRFLVPPTDRIPGNAATFYYKGMVSEGPDWISQTGGNDEIGEWLSWPLDRVQHELHDEYQRFQDDTLQSLQTASRCETCDWGDSIREYGISTLLPQAQKMRSVARVIALRARYQLSENRFDDALATMGLGYALSRNLAHGCCLVQDLIGMAIQNLLDQQARTLIACENSPNLYWAFTDLATQPIDLQRGLSFESKMWDFTIHELADLDRRTLSNAESLDLAIKVFQIGNSNRANRAALLLWAVETEAEARKYLIESGFSAAKLDRMPILQMALLYRWRQFEIVRDDCFKSLYLPESELRTETVRSDKAVKTAVQKGEGQPFTSLLPAVHAANYARMRSQRQTNLLRIVEALRMYAAEYGKWPAALDEIKAAPVPRDPYTDKPFEYTVKDGVAVLSSTHLGGGSGSERYELTLRRPQKTSTGQEK
jgi:hypothetical protein